MYQTGKLCDGYFPRVVYTLNGSSPNQRGGGVSNAVTHSLRYLCQGSNSIRYIILKLILYCRRTKQNQILFNVLINL